MPLHVAGSLANSGSMLKISCILECIKKIKIALNFYFKCHFDVALGWLTILTQGNAHPSAMLFPLASLLH